MNAKNIILNYINDQDEKPSYIAKEIWDHPQVALTETFASKLFAKELEDDGFNIEWGAVPSMGCC